VTVCIDRLNSDDKHVSVDVDLPPYNKQFHDDDEDASGQGAVTSKGSFIAHEARLSLTNRAMFATVSIPI